MGKNTVLENITIDKLIFGGKGLACAPDGKKIIISGGCIPGSVVDLRILKEKKSYYEAQELRVIKRSPIEVPLEPGHQLYGGAKWLTIRYEEQLKIKEQQVEEAFHRLAPRERDSLGSQATGSVRWHPIVASPEIYGYRNKVEFSWGKYISLKEGVRDDFRFGFHVQGQFDRIIDCTYCALADEEINTLFREVDTLSRSSGFPTYDPKTGEGFWRHFVVRKGKKTGEIMLIFSVNGYWKDGKVKDFFTEMVQQLTEKYTHIVSISFLENTGRADIVAGNPVCIFGKDSIVDELLGYTFAIQPKSFFQVNTLGAEKLYSLVGESMRTAGGSDTEKGKILLDLYAGTGTLGILFARYFETVYSVELVESASQDGEKNAIKNGLTNVHFICQKVEDFALEFARKNTKVDTIILDPPRDGLHPRAIPSILEFGAEEIIYISCNPATLVRDLEIFLGSESLRKYRITDIIPVDMFPHTHHIETVVRLERV